MRCYIIRRALYCIALRSASPFPPQQIHNIVRPADETDKRLHKFILLTGIEAPTFEGKHSSVG